MTDTESSETSVIPLWTDDALDSEDDDRLDRKRFVDMVAGRIDACELGQKSTVFGLVGPWGSGKTSLIKFVLERLADNWKVEFFSPWASNNSTGLQLEFLAALSSLLEGDDKKAREHKEKVRKYASALTPLLGAIPTVGTAAAGTANKFLELTDTPWHKQFEAVSEALESLGKRVLLVADDIDRLDGEEILTLLKVVRLLGRFPNVHYLIAYDQTTVETLLKMQGLGERSSAFMEKIVQYPFEVPPIAPVIQRKLLAEAIDKFLRAHKIVLKRVQSERFSEFIGVVAPSFATARAQNRFGEQLLAFGGMLDFKEIDVVDFVVLSYLRTFHHRLYERIWVWKTELQSGKDWSNIAEPRQISDEEWNARILPLVKDEDEAVLAKHLLASLFKGVTSRLLQVREHPQAIYEDEYFHRYFLLGVPEDDVPDQLILSALSALASGSIDSVDVQRYREILDGDDDGLAALAYEKSQQLRPDGRTEPSAALVLFLFERLNALPNRPPSFYSAVTVLWRWVVPETFRCLKAGQLTVSQIIYGGLNEESILRLAGRLISSDRELDDVKLPLLKGFLGFYRDRLLHDLKGLLDSNLDFNSVIFVVSRLTRDESFYELGDALLDGAHPQMLDRVVAAMVSVNRWGGNEDELVFNSDTLQRVFRMEAIIQLADKLPPAPKLSSILRNEVSEENQAYFARASVKASAEARR